VDDNATIRRMLASAFLSDGFKTCVEAANGKEAIDVAKQNKPDVIVLDLSMPVMNGFAVGAGALKIIAANSDNSLYFIRAESARNRDVQVGNKPSSREDRASISAHHKSTPVNG
jgi:CheY-like chemotaxis protein